MIKHPVGVVVLWVIILGVAGYFLWWKLKYRNGCGKWDPSAQPSAGAELVKVETKKDIHTFLFSHFRTEVTFSDGYRFVSYETNKMSIGVEKKFSVNQQLQLQIAKQAVAAHEKAVQKYQQKHS